MNFKKNTIGLIALAVTAIGISSASACTAMQIKTEDGATISGRTLEFAVFLDTSAAFSPRGYEFTGQTTMGSGKKWTSKYASIGAIIADNKVIVDGINEKGLAVGTLYLPGYTEYPKTTKENQAISMSMSDFPQWILSSFATVEEVKKAVENNEAAISGALLSGFPPSEQPFHYILHDASGKSIVIESVKGKLIVSDNPLGVLTNSPTFDWHMTNLKNYVNLQFDKPAELDIKGIKITQTGQGSGMLGLPGDITPPSRFVRAVAFSTAAKPEKTADKGVFQLFHIFNNFDIPIGVARETGEDGNVYTDATLLTCIRDHKNIRFYYNTYDDQSYRMLELKAFDLDSKKIILLNTKGHQTVKNVSKELK